MSDLFRSAKPLDLRPYQLEAIEQVRAHIRAGAKNVCLVAPTGSGKTVIGSHLLNEASTKMRKSVFVVDRITLTNQTSETLDNYGISHGVMQGNHERVRPWERVQVASAQTLARRRWPESDLIIVDECHTVMKTVADRISKREAVTIGLTATPFTKGLGKLYDALVNVTTTNRLIADGFLAPYRIFAAGEPDMKGVKVVAGEWVEGEASKRALQVVGDVVVEYTRHGEGRKFICSACDVAHAEEIARQFKAAGIRVEAYSYRTSDEDRLRLVQEFRKPDSQIRGLVSPVALTKGFDVPDIGCVIMARPLRKSLAEHIQFFGRGLRIHPNKVDCIVLDHSGNSLRFWNEWNDFFETGATELDDGKRQEKKPKDEKEPEAIKCPQCKHLHMPRPTCPCCGYAYPKKQSVQHVAGDLRELVAAGDRNALSTHIWPQVCGYVRQHDGTGDTDRMRRRALALYKQMTGGWPKGDFASTQSAPVSEQVAGKIRSLNIAYIKGRQWKQRQAA